MMNKIYVGQLTYNTSEQQVKETFGKFGAIKTVHLVMDKATGRSRGFGFVEFENKESADSAIKAMNGKEFDGRSLVVNLAKPQAPRTRDSRDSRGGHSSW